MTATAIAGEGYGGLVLTSTGLVYGWGLNNFGEVGDGTTTVRSAPVPVSLPAGVTVTKIAGEFSSGLALASNGQVLAWGDNADGELGSGSTAPESLTPVAVSLPAGDGITAIAGEAYDGLALTSAGKVLAWGLGADGELGDNSPTSSNIPVSVDLPSTVTVTAIGSEAGDGLAITSTGAVRAWGQNGDGQLGDNSTTTSETPSPWTSRRAFSPTRSGKGSATPVWPRSARPRWSRRCRPRWPAPTAVPPSPSRARASPAPPQCRSAVSPPASPSTRPRGSPPSRPPAPAP